MKGLYMTQSMYAYSCTMFAWLVLVCSAGCSLPQGNHKSTPVEVQEQAHVERIEAKYK